MHQFKIGDRVRRECDTLGGINSGAFSPDLTGTVIGRTDACYHVRVDGYEGDQHVFWHDDFVRPYEQPRLVIDQLWAKLQAGGLTAQQVRAALRNAENEGGWSLSAWRVVSEHRYPLRVMFTWIRTPEGENYWNRLDNQFR